MSRKPPAAVKLPKLTAEPSTNASQGTRTDYRTALAVRRLRSRLQSLRQHPLYGPKLDMSTTSLLKWLQVSGNDVFAADAKIRRSLDMREKMKIDSFMSIARLPKIFRGGYPGGLCGVDREGSPVYYELCGLLELKDILKSAGKDNFFRYKFYQHEKIQEFLKEIGEQRGEAEDSILVVVDLQFCQKDNLCPANLTIFSELLHLLVDNYPTMIKEIVCINVPDLPELPTAQNYFKRDTWNLISLIGRKYIRRLKRKIAIAQLPVYLGGKKHSDGTRPDVGLDIEWSVKIPQLTLKSEAPADLSTYAVGPGIRKIEEYHVAAAGSTLTWDFDLISRPVNMSVYFSSLGHQNRLVKSPELTMDSDMKSGSLDCKLAGRYLFLVDNKEDLQAPASVRYRVTVTPPDSYMTHLAPMIPLVKPVKPKTVPSICRRNFEVTQGLTTPNLDWLNSI